MNNSLLNGFRAKLQTLFSAPDTVNNIPGADIYVQLLNPGLPISSDDLDFSLSSNASARAAADFARLSNQFQDPWATAGSLQWNIYSQALTNTVLAQNTLTVAEQKKLQDSRDLLIQHRTISTPTGDQNKIIETAQYAMYKQLMTAYDRARLKYNNLKITAQYSDSQKDKDLWNLNEPIHRQALARYYGDWVSRGNKNDVESAIQFIDRVTGRGPALVWSGMKNDFAISKRTSPSGNDYYDTSLYPENVFKTRKKDWITVTCQLSEAQNIITNTNDDNTVDTTAPTSQDLQSISVDLYRASIVRPWFNTGLFNSRAWKWSADTGIDQPLSDGIWPPDQISQMPVYSSWVIFARNLVITGNQLSSGDDDLVGPFTLGGAQTTSTTISSNGTQIIGFVCDKTPKSPNPDPDLQWLQ